ncbi:MocR-like pyridoxine biosynthesis transcription factor PdxR [Verminephrobacter eiseniae]|uniref:MocR-like pyridoxine biosynthesis transcription factor PdxR n=1 Tax=Verminephrobacter eiseniae TaxID=364317 RepID=UPI0010D5D53C|nr:PLP-dependent aminotransferase family protein [Verminephrobacter eiseniae]KAB7632443.1 PLP-dependent aminotransferase family protein [Verminephrobacter sp. Larva24]MCW5234774.1 PLP-dependent aminotransferase family protein [Verminephrobacter eiseniae]MCW5294073.1 PLP-dependent aminotransferase family protein [Verminephrobacter eiseniae]MCW8183189.1 PLP-dependent aminotransferase family protein [Verminephrobacter eiseniae]MCW8222130.1 PLP-dependent aminotransferase family protein [Verminephr
MEKSSLHTLTALDCDKSMPLYRQVYQRFICAIKQDIFASGQRVPSIRALASELRISRNTVEVAYDLLIGEGHLEAQGQAGTIVSPVSPYLRTAMTHRTPGREINDHKTLARTGNDSLYDTASEIQPLPYQLGLPALDMFPHKLWSSLIAQQIRKQSRCLAYPHSAGHPQLREAIAAYLHISRGLDCTPEQVFITSGYRGSIGLIGRTLLRPLDQVWLEDPCFPPSFHLMSEMGAQLMPVPVDEHGLCVAEGRARAPHARFALVTPAHQSPLGVSLSLVRRLELLAWAEQNNSFIIEDDYDSEYRYDGWPLPVLASLGVNDNVLYLGTFSKVLSPALRIAYLVVPKPLIQQFNKSCPIVNDGCPLLIQGVIADFINEGYFSRHLKKMRTLYSERREMVIESLHMVFGDRLRFDAPACGLHLLARLDHAEDDLQLAQRAKRQQFGVAALSVRNIEAECGKGLLLGFANVSSREQALLQAHGLHQCLG